MHELLALLVAHKDFLFIVFGNQRTFGKWRK